MAGESSGNSTPEQGTSREFYTSTKNNPCSFCRRSAYPVRELIYEDWDYVSYASWDPVSNYHYIVIPRKHTPCAKKLSSVHLPVIERMAEIGRQILTDRGCDLRSSLIGFSWHPLIRVSHLHMHVISPAKNINWFQYIFIYNKYFIKSPEFIVDYIKNKP